MNQHLTEEQVVGYVCQTLPDAVREEIDAHVLYCSHCRAVLAQHQSQQQQLKRGLREELQRVPLPTSYRFVAIAPQLGRRHQVVRRRQWLGGFTLATAVSGLALALLSLWQLLQPPWQFDSTSLGVLPSVACLCLGLATVGQFEQRPGSSVAYLFSHLLALLLWLGTAVVGLQNIVVLRDLFIWAAIGLGEPTRTAVGLSSFAVIVAALLWIVVVIGGAEYHRRRVGQPQSWRLFAFTIACQLGLLLLPWLLF